MKKLIFSLFYITPISASALTFEQRAEVSRLLTPETVPKIIYEICMSQIVQGFEQNFYKLPYSEKNKRCSCYTKGILNEFNWRELKSIALGEYHSVWNRQNRVDKIFYSCFLS